MQAIEPLPPIDPLVAEMVSRLPSDLQELWEERAAIREFDANQTRELAEAMALIDVLRGYFAILYEGPFGPSSTLRS